MRMAKRNRFFFPTMKGKTMMTTTSKRADYLAGDLTHDDYYGLLVDLLGERALRSYLPGQRSAQEWADLAAEDRSLNNVPLAQWDRIDSAVRDLLSYVKRDELHAITGSGGWSLSDSVCVLKATARRVASEV